MKNLETKENLHNFHFKKTEFFSDKWKNKQIYLRQIAFDSPMPETWFALDIDTFDLFIYFEGFGTKVNPRLIKIGEMPKKYTVAITYVAGVENSMLSIINCVNYNELKNIKTTKDLQKYLGLYATPV